MDRRRRVGLGRQRRRRALPLARGRADALGGVLGAAGREAPRSPPAAPGRLAEPKLDDARRERDTGRLRNARGATAVLEEAGRGRDGRSLATPRREAGGASPLDRGEGRDAPLELADGYAQEAGRPSGRTPDRRALPGKGRAGVPPLGGEARRGRRVESHRDSLESLRRPLLGSFRERRRRQAPGVSCAGTAPGVDDAREQDPRRPGGPDHHRR